MRRIVPVLSACLSMLWLAAWPSTATAWGGIGHRVIAAIAEQEMDPATRAAALALLEPGTDSLSAVSMWADEVREFDRSYGWSVPLHWVNFEPGQCQYEPARECPAGRCVVGAIEHYARVLGDHTQPQAARREALKFVIHFVGDVHQPLHAGFARDRGGNDFQINFERSGWNLHSVWDSLIFNSLTREWEAHLARLQPSLDAARSELSAAPAKPMALGIEARQWAEESCRIVQQDDFYPPRHLITRSYLDTQRPVADRRLQLAGLRLAALLEAALKP